MGSLATVSRAGCCTPGARRWQSRGRALASWCCWTYEMNAEVDEVSEIIKNFGTLGPPGGGGSLQCPERGCRQPRGRVVAES
jgi:hypothetical protein